jgi:uncharacterized protein
MTPAVFIPKPTTAVDRLSYDLETGVIKDDRQVRMIWIPEDLIQAIHFVIKGQMRGVASQTLYNFGRYWGERFFKQVEMRIMSARPGLKRIQEVSVRDFIKTCDALWADLGWGHFELVQAHGQIFVNLYNSPYAQTVGQCEENVDYMFAGIFAGIFSELSGPRLECVEIMCFSNGYDYCRFIQGGEQVVSVIKTWQAQGANYEEIIQRIQQQHASRGAR